MRFISPTETYERTSVSPREQQRKPGFPKSFRIGSGLNGRRVFLESEVLAWQEAQLARRDLAQQTADIDASPTLDDEPAQRPRGRRRKHERETPTPLAQHQP